jgi:hypothetical protein
MIGSNSEMIGASVDADLWIGLWCFSWIKWSFDVEICFFRQTIFWFYNKLWIEL